MEQRALAPTADTTLAEDIAQLKRMIPV